MYKTLAMCKNALFFCCCYKLFVLTRLCIKKGVTHFRKNAVKVSEILTAFSGRLNPIYKAYSLLKVTKLCMYVQKKCTCTHLMCTFLYLIPPQSGFMY